MITLLYKEIGTMLNQKQKDEICDSLINILPYTDKVDLEDSEFYIDVIGGNINCKCDTSLTYDDYDEIMEYAKEKWNGIIVELI